ncbi:MAG: c-type cytochrome, partial [Verrucomicrobia bacterium]|nr:c-type cytochrome [Verrucomicrobiota bacterium]
PPPTRRWRLAISNWQLAILATCLAYLIPWQTRASLPSPAEPLAPVAFAATPDNTRLFIACAAANQVAVFDVAAGKVAKTIEMPDSPLGLALSADGKQLFVTCAAPSSSVCIVDTAANKIIATIPAGHTAMAPVLSPDGKTLYVCNRFNNCVSAIDRAQRKEVSRVAVPREPVAAAVTPDGKLLLVANHIHTGRADADVVAAAVTIIDTASGKVIKDIALPNGSGLLRDVQVSPDGKFACVTHVLARFHLPTTQLERGWMNTNALSIIDLTKCALFNTVLLDNVDSGAANPWAAAWSADGKQICVTHAGTHEVSIIDAPALLEKLAKMPAAIDPNAKIDYNAASRVAADVPNDLSFLVGVRNRIKLPDNGPRAIALLGKKIYTANYFSDSLSVIDQAAPNVTAASIPLSVKRKMTTVRKGEMLWNDATMCFQGWQSCSSCHSSDARTDGLNWDLLNDGIGNPKNSKSMLLSHKTPPAMSMGVRDTAETAVRSGIKNILFAVRPEDDAVAIDEYLKSLQPIPSPYLEKGKLSAAAQRGKKLFSDSATGCAKCHPTTLFSDLKSYDVGTRGQFDKADEIFDTPTLVEGWRTAPYLHDGSAATMRDVLTTRNPADKHGKTKHLSPQQIDDLTAYLLSL